MSTVEERKKHIGVSYIGSKAIHRIVAGPKDYRPLCLCRHESDEEALSCAEALRNLEAGTFPEKLL